MSVISIIELPFQIIRQLCKKVGMRSAGGGGRNPICQKCVKVQLKEIRLSNYRKASEKIRSIYTNIGQVLESIRENI
jgi:hypothetical protein